MKHVLTFPGFAESSHARGLYTDIQNAFSTDYQFHILPFYEEKPNGDRVVHSIQHHAETIQEYMDSLDGEITMLAKCAGSRAVISMDDDHIGRLAKLCLFNPPWRTSNRFLEYQLANWNGTKHEDGSWTVPREGQGAYVVTAGYIHSKQYEVDSVNTFSVMDRLRAIATMPSPDLYIVRGLEDEMFSPIRTDTITGARTIDIAGGTHHLTGESRKKVIGALALNNVL